MPSGLAAGRAGAAPVGIPFARIPGASRGDPAASGVPPWQIALVAAIGVLDATWIALGDFTIDWRGWLRPLAGLLVLGVLIVYYTRFRRMSDARIVETLRAVAMLIALMATIGTLSYLMTSLDRPLRDEVLVMMDRALGFHWLTWYHWVEARPALSAALALLYATSLLQIVVAVLLTGLGGRIERLHELVGALALSAAIIIVVSGFVPAACGWLYYEVGLERAYHWAHFSALRDGSLRVISPSQMEGIVTFPSYHTAISIIVPWALRGTRVPFGAAVVLNAGVLLSIPSEGGHYLVDMLAGAAITFAVIAWIGRRRGGVR